MNLKGKKVILKDGSIGEVLEHDKYVHVFVNDKLMKFNFKHAFENGFLRLVDESLEETLNSDVSKLKKHEKEISDKFKRKVYRQSIHVWKLDKLINSSYNGKYLEQEYLYNYSDIEKTYGFKIDSRQKEVNITDENIILVSSIQRNRRDYIYKDYFIDDGDYIFCRTAKGSLNTFYKENYTIINSKDLNKKIILLVRLTPRQYYDQGEFELVDFKEEESISEDGLLKFEVKFRLRKIK